MVSPKLVFPLLFLFVPFSLLYSQPRIVLSSPYEQSVDSTSVTLAWRTLLSGDSRVQYGLTDSLELSEFFDSTMTTQHVIPITGLKPSTIYRVQFSSSNSGGTSTGPLYTVSTASPASSTGTINVYFNKSVETSIATGELALENQRLDLRLIDRINGARYSIDCALYSLSGTPGPGDDVANALIAAKNRGVMIRIVMETDNSSTSPPNKLRSNGITIVTDNTGANDGAGLHHNKFFVFDYRDIRDSIAASAGDDWVWTGSWNPTQSGTFSDLQDVVEIQDQALAGAFTLEFEEMWGSNTDVSDPSNSSFGARKLDNTPHMFNVRGRDVRLFFSPSDGTSAQINLVLGTADRSIAFALLLITDNNLASTLVAMRQQGRKVRGVLDADDPNAGGDLDFLIQNGVDVLLDPNAGLLHHKYAIVDGEFSDSVPWVIVGSHNWTRAANETNDENVLIIQDALVANQFLQEFAARYYEAGGQDSILVAVPTRDGSTPAFSELHQNFPNPFNPTTTIAFELPEQIFVTVTVFNVLGEEIETLVAEQLDAGRYSVKWDASRIASGVYFYRLQSYRFVQTRKLILFR